MDLSNVRWRKSSYTSDNGGNCVEIAELWRKSSYTGSNGGNCVEVADPWHKCSHSGNNGGDCLEVAQPVTHEVVAVRDSKNPDGPKLFFSHDEWTAFVSGVKVDEFSRR
ncbi:hypothetical protein Skr01_70720 [Sphaerisporangium krabiense]|uniref:DUF397 domain-containing protein n=1 Tax=Sphaerisporangium krabiense TaxID=763782 RepID=A0A7W8Z0M1_9ACTN|nr:DUF397 domain-containing protein [Sphaerisporangium krabiense]MBB5624973.1 hypothetical protein [Sphaerisporangium krabiense]GII66987.1 hypothetical protein Skr01_70720 [Sphaerisporangium krabiense]